MSSLTDQQQQQQQQQQNQPHTPSANYTLEVIDAEEEEPIAASSSIKGYVSDEIEFRTPTSRDHNIPRSRSCPPAPRKPKPKTMAHKRKLMFEDAAREEVDAFFHTTMSNAVKRRSFGDRSGVGRVNTTTYLSFNGNNDDYSTSGGDGS